MVTSFKISVLFLLLLVGNSIYAQQDFTLYAMPHVPQRISQNPALIPEADVHIGLPLISAFYGSASNTGFSLSQLATFIANPTTYTGGYNAAVGSSGMHYLMANSKTDWLSYGVHYEDHYIGYNITERIEGNITYPKNLLSLLSGNLPGYSGTRFGLDGFGINYLHYREFALNYAYEIDYRWTAGARIKYLYGMESIFTRTSTLGVNIDAYSLNPSMAMDGALEVNTSGVALKDPIHQFNLKDYVSKKQNRGVALDLGFSFKPINSVEFSASLFDLGYIHFKQDVKTWIEEPNQLKVSKDDLLNMIKNRDFDLEKIGKSKADSIKDAVAIKTNTDPFDVPLNSRLLIGVSWKIKEAIGLSVLADYEFLRKDVLPGGAISLNLRPFNWMSACVNYSFYNNNFTNVGVGLSANVYPFLFYATSDNILVPFIPEQATNVHFRLGTSLIFGRKKMYKNFKLRKDPDEEIIID
ncbi:MAG: DUF5723 family protein [Bacteroidetes bacterium]|nr:DUF5723 family protein [Bacteroidota bacterium]